jgi:hypothetical protein
MKKYLKAWLVFVFFSVFLAITTALMLATNPCVGQAAVVLGWVTLAIYVFVFIGVLVAFLRPGWAIPVFRENLRWLEKPDPRKKVQRAQTTPALESDERSETDSDTDSGW